MSTVLVVDDHILNREFLLSLLGFDGYKVNIACDGVQGLALARSERPDVIVTDILMPHMDGFDVMARLRERELNAPVILLVSYATARLRTRAAENCRGGRSA